MEKPASTWSFDQGTLTVRHLGKTVSLGGYATHEFAAKAAAVYFAKHSGHCCLPQSRRAAAKAPQSGPSCLREPSNAEISERANSELLKRADTAAIEAASINRRMHQPSNGQVDRMYPPELLRVEAAECRPRGDRHESSCGKNFARVSREARIPGDDSRDAGVG